MTPKEPTIVGQFQEYKRFCLEQISNQNIGKDMKISFMHKIINDLMEQNELLLEMLQEVQQSATDRSSQMHMLLEKTAQKSCCLGSVLASVELDLQSFVKHSLPHFVDCVDLVSDIETHLEQVQHENTELHRVNQSFFDTIQCQNAELVQYKHLVYSLMFDKQLGGDATNRNLRNEANSDYLERVLGNQLCEVNDNLTDIVCTNILEEVVSTVESLIASENNDSHSCCDFSLSNVQNRESENGPKGFFCDINDNYELDLDESWDEHFHSKIDYLSEGCQKQLLSSYLATVCNELSLKTSVINRLKGQLSSIKNEHLALHNRYLEMAIQVLNAFSHIKAELESDLNGPKSQSLLDRIDSEMKLVMYSDSSSSPTTECHPALPPDLATILLL